MMDQQTFDTLIGEGYNRIPVSRTILGRYGDAAVGLS